MKISRAVQGLFFAPLLLGLIFLLKVTCPAPTGGGCFADHFLTPLFLPLTFIYKVLAPLSVFIAHHEPFVVVLYWMIVFFLGGLALDIKKEH
ncbi:MAG: hypothetical protein V4465_01950 [Patescibacteria group bacterium]